ncbi:hypothetical protein B0J14DRAFT_597846 [Halenospora varia]|nr:hypothetical protein B0J14DRAFT_597846 [Halenospora varia]
MPTSKPTANRVCDAAKDHTPHYFNLRISPQATEVEMKKNYRTLARLVHPDRNRDQQAAAHEATLLLHEAKEVLLSDDRFLYNKKWYLKNYRWEQERVLQKGLPPKRPWFRDYQQFNGSKKEQLHHLREEAWVESFHYVRGFYFMRSSSSPLGKSSAQFEAMVDLKFHNCYTTFNMTVKASALPDARSNDQFNMHLVQPFFAVISLLTVLVILGGGLCFGCFQCLQWCCCPRRPRKHPMPAIDIMAKRNSRRASQLRRLSGTSLGPGDVGRRKSVSAVGKLTDVENQRKQSQLASV